MEYAKLGNTDIEVSKLCVGCMSFGKPGTLHDWTLDESGTEEIVKHALDLGINFFDTANGYSDGTSEEYLGNALRKNVSRDKVVIASKVYFNPGRLSSEAIHREIEGSLKRLGTDYLDLYIIHRFDYDTPIEETMGALDQIVRSGKALYVGISRYTPEQTEIAIRTLRELGTPMLIHQENYSMLNRKIEHGLTDVLTREGVGLIAFGPLAGGRLTGKYQSGIPADSRIGHDPRYLKADMLTPGLHAAIDALSKIAAARGETLSQLALQWTLRDKAVTSALIGASRAEQITENVAALSLPPLTDEELAQIDAALALNEE